MRIRKNISFCARKLSDLFYDLSIFFKKTTSLYPFTSINDLDRQISILLPNLLNSKTFYIEVGASKNRIKFRRYLWKLTKTSTQSCVMCAFSC